MDHIRSELSKLQADLAEGPWELAVDEEQRRKAFVSDERNLVHAVDGAVDVLRALLRALVAKDPELQAGRALAGLRSLMRIYQEDLPAERVLLAAIAKLKDLDAVVAEDGYIVETTLLAIKYFAEATTEQSGFSIANRHLALERYRNAIRDVGANDQLRGGRGPSPA